MTIVLLIVVLCGMGIMCFNNGKTNKENRKTMTSLANMSQDLNKSNNSLRKANEKLTKNYEFLYEKYEEIHRVNTDLVERVGFLEEENRKFRVALENMKLIAPAFKMEKAFAVRRVK